ncbi:hypothetical protein LZ32DRAFT_660325 [Colletotrichum eremochloae]|nr:hypothetical protein LZ32DRAFT_660325 [Colletotrichum eremochloae]
MPASKDQTATWKMRARQLQRFHAQNPPHVYAEIITKEDLARARVLSPDASILEKDEQRWPDNWAITDRSLRSFLGKKYWKDLPQNADGNPSHTQLQGPPVDGNAEVRDEEEAEGEEAEEAEEDEEVEDDVADGDDGGDDDDRRGEEGEQIERDGKRNEDERERAKRDTNDGTEFREGEALPTNFKIAGSTQRGHRCNSGIINNETQLRKGEEHRVNFGTGSNHRPGWVSSTINNHGTQLGDGQAHQTNLLGTSSNHRASWRSSIMNDNSVANRVFHLPFSQSVNNGHQSRHNVAFQQAEEEKGGEEDTGVFSLEEIGECLEHMKRERRKKKRESLMEQ